jgi:VCBS repeat-containing protein
MRRKLKLLASRIFKTASGLNTTVESKRFVIDEIEPRILHSADHPLILPLGATGLAPESYVRFIDSKESITSQANQVSSASQTELVVIDRRVGQLDTIIDNIATQRASGRSIDILIIEADQNFFATVSNSLSQLAAQNKVLTGMHLVGHGQAGTMQMGNEALNQESVDANHKTLLGWRSSFSENADLLLYGCDFAQKTDGKALATQLADLTGTEVAASTDLVGNERLGANWTLEFNTGQIEASLIINLTGQIQYSSVFALNAVGTETLVNSGDSNGQSVQPSVNSVAMANNGSYAVVYTDSKGSGDIYVALFDAQGAKLGAPTLVNTSVSPSAVQGQASIAMDKTTGDFIVSWQGEGTADAVGVYYRRFYASGVALDPVELLANNTVSGQQTNPVIGIRTIHDFYIAWNDSDLDASGSAIVVGHFTDSGLPTQIQVNTTTASNQRNPSIAISSTGQVVIAWESELQDSSQTGIYFRQFDSTLSVGSPETRVNTLTQGRQSSPVVSMNSAGEFVIAWETEGIDGSGLGIAVQRFTASASPAGVNIGPVNSYTTENQERPNIALADDGSFVVTWSSFDQDSGGSTGVFAQAFKADGSRDGNEFSINTSKALNQENPAIAYNGSNAVIVWNGNGSAVGQEDYNGVFSQRYSRVPDINITSSSVSTSEFGQTATLNIVLTQAPTSSVILDISVSDPKEAKLSAGRVTFTALNWNIAQTVVVTGLDDRIVDGTVNYSVIIDTAVSADLRYSGINPVDLNFTNTDNDVLSVVTVDTALDIQDGDTSSLAALMRNKGTDGKISLREAILATNASANGIGGADQIEFNLSGSGVQNMQVLSSLPIISDAVKIDATTQLGYASTPIIAIDGSSAGINSNGLQLGLGSSGSQITGLTVRNFSGNGISVVDSSNNLIGGLAKGNQIVSNGQSGIFVSGNSRANTFQENIIARNIGLGIDLGPIGVNTNDLLDIDSGANDLQNFPQLQSAVLSNGLLTVALSLNSQPNTTFRIELFSNPAADVDPLGYGEGRTYQGFLYLTTDAQGNGSASKTLSASVVNLGESISATATQDVGNGLFGSTSEFSQNRIVVLPNQTPTITSISSVRTNEDTTLAFNGPNKITVADSDINLAKVQLDVNWGLLTLNLSGGASIGAGANGSKSITLLGSEAQINSALLSLEYRGDLNFNGSDSLIIVATDSLDLALSKTISIVIDPVNDSPTVSAVTLAAIAEDSGARTITQAQLLAGAQDVDGDTLVATNLAIKPGSLGSLVNNNDGTWTYTPAANDDTGVNFTFSIFDGTVSITNTASMDITPVNDAPTITPVTLAPIAEDSGPRTITKAELMAGVSDVDSPLASLSMSNVTIRSGVGTLVNNNNGTWTYTPAANDDTAVTFNFDVTDGLLSSVGVANLDITRVNDAPTATPVTLAAIAEDTSVRITQTMLLAGAQDVDGDTLVATNLVIKPGSLGSLVNNNDGTWTYTPAANDDTGVNFTFSIFDGTVSITNTASMDITRVNDAPTATPVTLAAIAEDSGARTITQAQLLAGAQDLDGDTLVATNLAIKPGSLGSLVNNNNGTWTYTPAANDDTGVNFTFSVFDGTVSISNTASMDITRVNDAPTATPVTLAAIAEDSGARTITQAQLLAGAQDVDGDTLVATNLAIKPGSLGSLVNNNDGTWTYTPAANDDTGVNFTFSIFDGTVSISNTASMDITRVNDAPTATPVTLAAIAEDSGARIITQAQLLAGAQDVDGDTLTVSNLAIKPGSLGNLVTNNNGTWTYTPANNDDTSVIFTYSITDGAISINNTAALDITAVNDRPVVFSPVANVTFIEDGVRISPFDQIVLTDIDSPLLKRAIITLSNANADDFLLFVDQFGINGQFVSGSNQLILSGEATLENYQAAIRSIQYYNTADLVLFRQKQLSIQVSDGIEDSATISETINLVNTNDPPRLSNNVKSSVDENDFITITKDELSFTDPDNTTAQLRYVLESEPKHGLLQLSTNPGVSVFISGFSQVDIDNGFLIYVHDGSEFTSDSFSFRVKDGSGGISDLFIHDIQINPIDDATTVTISSDPLVYTENAPAIFVAENAIISDNDNSSLSRVEVQISSGFSRNEDQLLIDSLAVSADIKITWDSNNGKLLLESISGGTNLAIFQDALRSVRYINLSESPNTNTRGITVSLFNSLAKQGTADRQLNVVAINDAPQIIGPSASILADEDALISLTGANRLQVNDVDSNNSVLRVSLSASILNVQAQIRLSDVNGLTFLSGTTNNRESMVFEGTIADINLALNGLNFYAGKNINGQVSLTIAVIDSADPSQGGPLSATKAVNFVLAAVNDAPTITGSLTTSLLQGASIQISAGMLGVIDVDNQPTSIELLTSDFKHGQLELTSAPNQAIFRFLLSDLTSGNIVYRHDGTTSSSDSFTVVASDGPLKSAPSQFTFVITQPVNIAPLVSPAINPAVTFTEAGQPVALTPNFKIIDPDSPNLVSATIRFLGTTHLAEDKLLFTANPGNNIRIEFDSGGVLKLSGSETVAEYEAAIRSIQFINTSDSPDLSIRTLEIIVNDGSATSNISLVSINLVATNDPPTIVTGTTLNGLEDQVLQTANAIGINDVDLSGGVLRIRLYTTEGTITLSSLTGLQFSAGDGLNDSDMTFVGTQAAINAAVNRISFLGNPNFNGAAQIRIEASDFDLISGGVASTSNGILNLNIGSVNDPPELRGTTTLLPYAESSGAHFIFSDLGIQDIDSTELRSAKVKITSGFVATEDRLAVLDSQGLIVNWNATTGVLSLDGVASVSTYQAVLRSVTFEDISRSAIYGNRQISLQISDGSFGTATMTRLLRVDAVNDAPILNSGRLTSFSENSAPVAILPNLSISDIDSVSLSSASIQITGSYQIGEDVLALASTNNILTTWNPLTGVLQLQGLATIAQYETALRQITFVNNSESPLGVNREFTLRLVDDGGATAASKLVGFNVFSINDAPVLGLGANLTFAEDTNRSLANSIFVSDVDADQTQLTLTLRVNNGALTVLGSSAATLVQDPAGKLMTVSGTLQQLTQVLQQLIYVTQPDYNGNVLLQLSLQDAQGARDVRSLQIQIESVNDAPSLTLQQNATVSIEAGTTQNFLNQFRLQDVDSQLISGVSVRVGSNFSEGDKLTVQNTAQIQTVWNSQLGVLTLTGPGSLSDYQTILKTLQFSTSSQNYGARNIVIALTDAEGATGISNEISIINKQAVIIAPNDPPKENPGITPTPPPAAAPPAALPSISNPPASALGNTAANALAASTEASLPATAGAANSLQASSISPATTGNEGKSIITKGQATSNADLQSNQSLNVADGTENTNRSRLNELSGKNNVGQNGAIESGHLSNPSTNSYARESETDSRSAAAADQSRDSRLADNSSKLFQLAQRDSQLPGLASASSVKFSLLAADNDTVVEIKVSKSDQLAVDLLSLPAQSGGVVVSAAVLWWITRAGGLLTALLTSLPSWQHFDPLPVVAATDGREDDDWGEAIEEDDKELDAVLAQ